MTNYPGTTGNDVFNIGIITESSTVSGEAGNDTLNVNWSTKTNGLSVQAGLDLPEGRLGYPGLSLKFTSIERLNIRFGSGRDTADIMDSKLPFAFDGGAGVDLLKLNLSAVTANVSFQIPASGVTATIGGHGSTVKDFEQFEFLLGSGNDRIILGNGDDYIEDSGGGNNVFRVGGGTNMVYGGAGNDLIEGGSGKDWLSGGGGIDTLSYESAGSGVTVSLGLQQISGGQETGGAGNDSLGAFENIVGSAFGDRLSGDEYSNILYGGAGNDILDGSGIMPNQGTDQMFGGSGNDTYVVRGGAVVVEDQNAGSDTVNSWIDYTLPANFENLVLIGSTAINGSGNSVANRVSGNTLANTLYGGAGNDVLDGGAGADTLRGGSHDDTYVVDNSGDLVIEAANAGTDTVSSLVNYLLPVNVENLVLAGTAGLEGRGNAMNNVMTGNDGANLLTGGSGNDTIDGGRGNDRIFGHAGNDSLKGGVGTDNFYFNTALGSANVDKILDFSVANDTIYLARTIFPAIANGTLAASAFRTGSAAADASDRIVYDQASGKIFYDSDGNGSAAAILFTTVAPGTALTNADFIIYS